MNQYPALKSAVDLCIKQRVEIPLDLLVDIYHVFKTEAHYLRVLDKAVQDLYAGEITEDDFLGTMTTLLDEQIRRAWNEGMRANELDPATDMTDEWEARIQELIDYEFDFVQQFMDDIMAARADGAGVDALRARAGLWANRYNEVVNTSKLETAEPKDKFEWIYGDTEHCDTCAALNGLVASAAEWEESGFHPQQPPNDMLTCGGWRCACSLEPTDKRRSPGVLTRLLDIATARGV